VKLPRVVAYGLLCVRRFSRLAADEVDREEMHLIGGARCFEVA
jgi:hypothetical protein